MLTTCRCRYTLLFKRFDPITEFDYLCMRRESGGEPENKE
jgi:hypothetical protein